MLSYSGTVLLTVLQIVAWFLVLFVLLPQFLFPAKTSKPWTYHLFDHVVRMSFASIIIVHGLAFLNIYDLLSLIASFIGLHLAYQAWIRKIPVLSRLRHFQRTATIAFFDLLDNRVFLAPYLKKQSSQIWQNFLSALPHGPDIWWSLALWIILLISGYLRLYEAISGPAPASADSYLHLFWLKGLGISRLYPDGLYPYGAYALLQIVRQFTLLDEVLLMHLAPGLVSLLLIVTIYWTIKRLTGRRSPALLSAALYGIFAYAGWLPLPLPSQGDVLTVEMALIFFLPTLIFLAEAIAKYLHRPQKQGLEKQPQADDDFKPRPSPLWLYFQSMACLFFIQPFVGILALLVAIGAIIVTTLLNLRSTHPTRLLNLSFGAALLGLLPLLLGLVQGKSLHLGPLRWDVHFFGRAIRAQNFLPEPPPTPAITPLLVLSLVGILFLLLLSIRPAVRGQRLSVAWQVFSTALLILFVLFQPTLFGLAEWLLPGQVARALTPVVCVIIGLSLHQVWALLATLIARRNNKAILPWPQHLELAITISILLIVLIPFPSILIPSPTLAITSLPKQEYDSVAAQIFRIKEEIPAYQWTVVAYKEALPQVFGQGFSIANEDFLESYQPETWRFDPRQPELAVPSPHVFIFIEKHPYIVPGTSNDQALERDLIRERLQAWVERYQELHTDMGHYYEDGVIEIYHIYRTPEEEARILEAIDKGQLPINIAPPAPQPQQAETTPTPDPTIIAPTQSITYQVKRGDVVNRLDFEGQIIPRTQQSLFFRTSGQISSTYAVPGDVVSAGQVIAELNTTRLEQALTQAKADLSFIEADGSVDDNASSDAQRAQLELEMARLRLTASQTQTPGPSAAETTPELERAFLALQQAENDFNEIQLALDTPQGQNEDLKRYWNDPWVSTLFEQNRALEEATENYLKDELFYEQAQQNLTQHDYDVAIAERQVKLAQIRVDETTTGPSPTLKHAVERAQAEVDRLASEVAAAEQVVATPNPDPDLAATQFEQLRDLEQQYGEAKIELKQAQAEVKLAENSLSTEAQQAEIDLWVAMIELESLQEQKPSLEFAETQTKASLERSEGVLRKAEDKRAQVASQGTSPDELTALHQAKLAYIRAQIAQERATNSVSDHEIMLREHEVEQAELNAAPYQNDTPLDFDPDRERALLEIERLEEDLANAQLIAPIDGTVLSISLVEGQQIEAFRPVAVIADLSQLEVSLAQVSPNIQPLLTPGLPVTVTLLADTDQPSVRGTIRQMPIATTPATPGETPAQNSEFRVTLDNATTESNYQVGDRVRVSAEIESQENTLWLPPQAILTSPDNQPFVILQDGEIEQQVKVQIGLESTDRVEIVSGLTKDQIVIVKE